MKTFLLSIKRGIADAMQGGLGWIASLFRRNTSFLLLLGLGVICLVFMKGILLWPRYASTVLNGSAGLSVRSSLCQAVNGCVDVKASVEWVASEGAFRTKFAIVGNGSAMEPNKNDAIKTLGVALDDGSFVAKMMIGDHRDVNFSGFRSKGMARAKH